METTIENEGKEKSGELEECESEESEGEGGGKKEKKEDSRIGALKLQKKTGNDLYQKGLFEEAYKEYEKGLRFFGVMFKEADPLRPVANVFKKEYHLNMALCSIRTKDYPEVKVHCNFVINELGYAEDPKAHYRKGVANKEMGLFDEAKNNFQKVIEIDIDETYTKRAFNMLNMMKKEETISNNKSKKLFGGMFKEGGAMEGIYGDKKDVDLEKLKLKEVLEKDENEESRDDDWFTTLTGGYISFERFLWIAIISFVVFAIIFTTGAVIFRKEIINFFQVHLQTFVRSRSKKYAKKPRKK